MIGILRYMSKNTSFSLDEHYSAFIEEEVASGRYRSASDVVRSALRLLEERETRLNALRHALTAGERSGESQSSTSTSSWPASELSLNPWIDDFERSSGVLVICGRAWMRLARA